MFHVNHLWDEPLFLNHHSSHRVTAVGLILLDLGLEALESNNFTEKDLSGSLVPQVAGFQILLASSDKKELVARCSMLTALCPPIHRENGVSSKTSRVHGISTRGFALYETKTITFTQGHPCRNRRLGFPGSSPKLWLLDFWAQNCGSKGGALSETRKSNF